MNDTPPTPSPAPKRESLVEKVDEIADVFGEMLVGLTDDVAEQRRIAQDAREAATIAAAEARATAERLEAFLASGTPGALVAPVASGAPVVRGAPGDDAAARLVAEIEALSQRTVALERYTQAAIGRLGSTTATATAGEETEWLARLAWGAMVLAVLALVIAFAT